MNTSTSTLPQASRKRRRPAVVCTECRRRKIACDRKAPCGQCIQYDSTCTYYTPGISTVTRTQRTPANDIYTPSSSTNLETFGSTEVHQLGMFDGPAGPPPSVDDDTSIPVASVNTQSAGPLIGHSTALQNLREATDATVYPLPNPNPTTPRTLNSRGSTNPERSVETVRTSRPHLKGRFLKSRLFGQSHWMNGCMQVRLSLWALCFHLVCLDLPGHTRFSVCV